MIVTVSYRLGPLGQRNALLRGLDAASNQTAAIEVDVNVVERLGDRLRIDGAGNAYVELHPAEPTVGEWEVDSTIRQAYRSTDKGMLDAPIENAEQLLEAIEVERKALALVKPLVEVALAERKARAELQEIERAQTLKDLRQQVMAGNFSGIAIDHPRRGWLGRSFAPHDQCIQYDGGVSDNDDSSLSLEAMVRAELAARADRQKEYEAQRLRDRDARIEHLKALATATGEAAVHRLVIHFPQGNPRRYGRPWIGLVTDLPASDKPSLSWGVFEGDSLFLEAPVGSLIMWGQKDLRRPDKTERNYGVIEADGKLHELASREEALRYWGWRTADRGGAA